eukprot:TRINITY_DN2963_c0_g1_i4.p1 TRINITY_DN2963_c0_g1~~TRINITY_DN2963_c0_g1_i4.p1  ORF type:complete len:134 (-),score=9.03 TRINITY_DN2963_c0_g1_i4:127-528(-)
MTKSLGISQDMDDDWSQRETTTELKTFQRIEDLNLKRRDYTLAGSRLFTIDDFMSDEECRHYIEEAEKQGFESLEREFKRDHRNNLRCSTFSQKLADIMFERIKFFRKKTSEEFVLLDKTTMEVGFQSEWIPG